MSISTTLVLSDGTWQVTLPASVVQGLADNTYPVVVSMTHAAVNLVVVVQTTLTAMLTV